MLIMSMKKVKNEKKKKMNKRDWLIIKGDNQKLIKMKKKCIMKVFQSLWYWRREKGMIIKMKKIILEINHWIILVKIKMMILVIIK